MVAQAGVAVQQPSRCMCFEYKGGGKYQGLHAVLNVWSGTLSKHASYTGVLHHHEHKSKAITYTHSYTNLPTESKQLYNAASSSTLASSAAAPAAAERSAEPGDA